MMHDPIHPGEILKEEIIRELGVSVPEAAESLAISSDEFLHILTGQAAVSPDLAVRLENAGLSTARSWLAIQRNYDLWQAKQREQPKVKRLRVVEYKLEKRRSEDEG